MRTAALAAGVLLLAAWPSAVLGGVIVSLNNPGSTTLHEVWVEPGGRFDVDINLNAVDLPAGRSVGWVSLVVQANASEVFDALQVTDVDPWSSQGTVTSIVGGIDPISGRSAFTGSTVETGLSRVASVQFAVAPGSLLGAYGIDATGVLWTDSPVNGLRWPGGSGPTFAVHVIPEPASMVMILSFGLVLSRRWS